MSGRGERQGRGNRGGRDGNSPGGRGRGGRGRGNTYSGLSGALAKHKGLCAALGIHVFDYGQKGAAGDQMRTTWEKIVHHVGTIYGHDISNELQNKKTVIINEPKHTQDVLDKHAANEVRRQTQQTTLDQARLLQKTQLEAEAEAGTNMDAPMLLAILDNEIDEAIYQATLALPIKLGDMEQTHHYNKWRSSRRSVSESQRMDPRSRPAEPQD
jgi:hypothetical protein